MSECLRAYALEECGKDGYPRAWHTGIKQLVREQAGHRCVRCLHPYPPGIAADHPRGEWTPCDVRCTHDGPVRLGTRDGWIELGEGEVISGEAAVAVLAWDSRVEAQYRILTVHHLDGDKRNCRWWNLAPLCQRCHLQIQGKVKMAQLYPFEHSEWMKPYAAGYYAFHYRGEDLDRSQTEARLEELLALELA